MPSPYFVPALVLATAALGMVGACGTADDSAATTSGTPSDPRGPACDDFCARAADVGCPKAGDCAAGCRALFDLGCEDFLADFLACAGPGLTAECVPRGGDGQLSCTDELSRWDACIPFDVPEPIETCGPSNAQSDDPAAGCHGDLTCDGTSFTVDCDAEGTCTCGRDGQALGTCEALLGSAYLCAPHRSCCSPFFAP